jgi:protein involved in polysaccharide export with SLBB domain
MQRVGGALLALHLLSAAPAFAQIPDVPPASEMLGDQVPGQEAVESLRRMLSVPSAGSRWRGLPQFGRELFRGAEQRFSPVEDGPVGPDYVLGPGDNLIVFVSALTDTSFALTIDREGKVFLPRVGTTFLWGLCFADADALIRARLATVLRNARIQVSMGRVRTLDVFVLGAVERPGKITLTGFATAFNALYAAGGPNSFGSLRNIRVLRANREVARLDLYRFLLDGDRGNDARLQTGDVVFVGLTVAQVGIQGAVTRPGIYESDGPMSLRALLDLAAGPSPFADLSRIHIERVDANGGFRLQDLALDRGRGIDPDSLLLSNYDLVTVFPLNERVRNVVTLDGYVRHPGEYELTKGLRLSQLLASDRMLPEAVLDQAEIRRVDSTTFQVEVRAFSVRRAWSGEDDLELRPLDAVTIFSSARFPRSVSIEGEVMRPGTYTLSPGERLSGVLRRAGGLTPQGYLPAAVFRRASAAARERSFLREFVERQHLDLAQQQARLAQSGDSTAASQVSAAQTALTVALERQTDPGRVVLDLDEQQRWIGTGRDPVLEGGDRFFVPVRPTTVTVIGSVMNPGTLLARRHASFEDYLELAGGLTRQADLSRGYVLKANGEALPRRAAPRIEPGDAIVVPPREIGTGGVGRAFSGSARFLMEIASVAALFMAATR